MKSKNLHVVTRATLSPSDKIPWFSAWLPVAVVLVGIFVSSSIPGRALPPPVLFPGQDKLGHGLGYGLLGFFFARAWRLRGGGWPAAVGLAVAAALAYGISDEFHQSFVPGRSVEGLDVVADATGGVLGALLAATAWRRAHARRLRSHREPG
jgi:VanZ family protein